MSPNATFEHPETPENVFPKYCPKCPKMLPQNTPKHLKTLSLKPHPKKLSNTEKTCPDTPNHPKMPLGKPPKCCRQTYSRNIQKRLKKLLLYPKEMPENSPKHCGDALEHPSVCPTPQNISSVPKMPQTSPKRSRGMC